MKLTCKQLCRIKEALANLKCPDCFSTEVTLCEEQVDENAECEACGCRFEFGPRLPDAAVE